MSSRKFSASKRSPRSVTSSILSSAETDVEKRLKMFVAQEDHELVVYSIREELIDNVMEIIHQRYLEEQAVKFTVHCAYRSLVQLLHYYYLNHDPGRPFYDQHPDWLADAQNEPSTPDTWSGYKLPVRPKPLPSPLLLQPETVSDMQEQAATVTSATTFDQQKHSEHGSELTIIYEMSNSDESKKSYVNDVDFKLQFYREMGAGSLSDEEEAEDDEPIVSVHRASELSIFTKTAISTRKESLPPSLSLGFSKICDVSTNVPKLPNIFSESLPAPPVTKLNLNVEMLPPLRAEAKYKPVAQADAAEEKLQLKKK